MTKYFIKNCTSLDSDGTTCQDFSYEDCGADDCINRTDCIVKQIVELCKEELKGQYSDAWNLAQKIIKLFNIQEDN